MAGADLTDLPHISCLIVVPHFHTINIKIVDD